jgi:peptidoglycan/xylan/chitin deacetylase (PgdA/CDA1 family)
VTEAPGPPTERPPRERPLPASLWLSAGLHLAAAAGLALAPRRWPLAVGAVVADHAVLAAAGLWPRSRLLGPNLRRLSADRAAAGEVALTFDDGPDPETTPRVLDLLDRHGARASFFCIGLRALAHPGLVAEIVRRGHRVENHTYRHSYRFALLGPWKLAREIDRAQQVLTAAAGRAPVYLRAPAGLRGPWLEPVLARRGLLLASWTRRGFDTFRSDPARVAARLTRGLAAGDVLLLHDAGAACDRDGRPVVLPALARVLTEIAARGLFATPLPVPAPIAGTSR